MVLYVREVLNVKSIFLRGLEFLGLIFIDFFWIFFFCGGKLMSWLDTNLKVKCGNVSHIVLSNIFAEKIKAKTSDA
jgi:hypothetical protein